MGDDAVLIVLALLWRWLDSLLWGLGLLVLGMAGVVIAAALLVWAGHTLPTGRRPVCGPSDGDEMTQTGPPVDEPDDAALWAVWLNNHLDDEENGRA